jgi:5'-3' exonuclease
MGIPSYFSYVLKNHNKIIKKLSQTKCNQLYIDANSIIYDVVNESITNIYEDVYNRIMSIINKLNPEFTFIAFDGVVPLAKMKQQKQRRYKSWLTKQILNTNNSWNTNAITPGTTFMNDLDIYLNNKFNTNNIIFSGSNETGEGEHKITKYLRSHITNKNVMIYGLDADLIMLGLLNIKYNENTYLYRETKHFSYLNHIDVLQDYTFNLNEMSIQIAQLLKLEKQKAIDNYCFLCFLFGNDFMPHHPSLNIRNNGIPYLIELFNTLNLNLVNKNKINWTDFKKLCIALSLTENERILENIKWKQNIKSTPLNKADELNILPMKDMDREIYLSQHLDKYYTLLFGQTEENPCKNYLKMLEWTWEYYNGMCKDNYIYYEFHLAPLFKSIINYIPCFNEDLLSKNVELLPSPITQLLYVLPYNDYNLIPKNVEHIIKKYPNLIEMDNTIYYDFCKFFWESHVDFKYINIKELNKLCI